MLTVKRLVAGHAGIRDIAVPHGAPCEPAGPVLRRDGDMLARQVLVAHVHEAALSDAGFPPVQIAYAHGPQIKSTSQIERLSILQNIEAAQVEPVSVVDAEGQWQPVGEVDQVLTLDRPAV